MINASQQLFVTHDLLREVHVVYIIKYDVNITVAK